MRKKGNAPRRQQPAGAAPDLSAVPARYRDKPVDWKVGWLRGWNKVKNGRAY